MNEDVLLFVCCLKTTVDTICQNWATEGFDTADTFINIF